MTTYLVSYTDATGVDHIIDHGLTETEAHIAAEHLRDWGCSNVAVYPTGMLALYAAVMAEPVRIDDDSPDFDHLDASPAVTR